MLTMINIYYMHSSRAEHCSQLGENQLFSKVGEPPVPPPPKRFWIEIFVVAPRKRENGSPAFFISVQMDT